MSGPLTCLCACLYLDPFPLSLDLSMMIQRITSVNFSPGNIQPSSLHRIACLTWALYMVGRLPNANAHSLGTSSASWSGRQLHTSPSTSGHVSPKMSAAGASSYNILWPVCHTLLVL